MSMCILSQNQVPLRPTGPRACEWFEAIQRGLSRTTVGVSGVVTESATTSRLSTPALPMMPHEWPSPLQANMGGVRPNTMAPHPPSALELPTPQTAATGQSPRPSSHRRWSLRLNCVLWDKFTTRSS
jgi:hypothetical protein